MAVTVFVVNPDAAALARQAIEVQAAGFGVIGVSGFAEARALIRARRPDVLLTTLRVGAYNGIHLAMFARMIHGPVPTIITGEADVVLQAEAERAGATYLVAPVQNVDLMTEIWSTSHCDGRSFVRAALAGSAIGERRGDWPGAMDSIRATMANN